MFLCHMLRLSVPPLGHAQQALDAFLRSRLGQEECDIRVPLDREYADAFSFAGHGLPHELSSRTLTIGDRFYIEPFLGQSEGNEHAHLEALFDDLLSRGECSDQLVSMSTLLLACMHHHELPWLVRTLVHQFCQAHRRH